jgi:uncharacterized protein YheU (UPF0270 family)
VGGVIVPHRELSAEILAAVVEEYVTRDGTELSDAGPKSSTVVELLDHGDLVLVYDPDSESCNIVGADQVPCPGDDEEPRVELD